MDHATELLLAAQRGDDDALERFVTVTQRDVIATCRYLGDRDNADDLAQLVYERAFRSLHRFRATGSARHWLLTIARRTCVDATRKRIRYRRVQQRLAALPHHAVGDVDGDDLDRLVLDLDDDRRAAFVLTQIVGLPYAEAAALLDVPIGTIRSRVSRAREQLVATLAATEVDPTQEPGTGLRRPHGGR